MEYEIVREWRKSLRLVVKKEKIIVKAPHFLPKSVIEEFVERNRAYIQKMTAPPRHFFYLSKKIPIRSCDRGWSMQDGIFFSDDNHRKNIESFLKEKAKAYIPQRVETLARMFGERYARVRITSARTRWGSCSARGNLNFTWRLMMHAPDVIDYVIVHELCHLTHMNHSKAFWELVESRMPGYRELEKELKRIEISI